MIDWEMKGKPSLLILHMQHGIVGAGNKSHPEFAKLINEVGIIPSQQALLKVFRAKKLPVIYINVKPPPVSGALPAYGTLWKVAHSSEYNPKDSEVISELTPQPGEAVLFNWPLSAFSNSGLEQVLKVYGVETLVVAGFRTDGIVFNAIQGGIDHCYSVIVPIDASTSPSTKAHEAVMEIMAPAIALVTTSEDIIKHL
jgi:nicotinamidase-related amidase